MPRGTKLEELTLMDVLPLSLGINTSGGRFNVLIPNNTTLPFEHTKIFHNNEDDQDHALIEVYEGTLPV